MLRNHQIKKKIIPEVITKYKTVTPEVITKHKNSDPGGNHQMI